jgi:hypothetical protein
MKVTATRLELRTLLSAKFPRIWTKDGEDFEKRQTGSIWTGEGSDMPDGSPAFDYWNNHYTFGVHPELSTFLSKTGWHAECYDPGTFFIYKD